MGFLVVCPSSASLGGRLEIHTNGYDLQMDVHGISDNVKITAKGETLEWIKQQNE